MVEVEVEEDMEAMVEEEAEAVAAVAAGLGWMTSVAWHNQAWGVSAAWQAAAP